jgi:hypothetical protein
MDNKTGALLGATMDQYMRYMQKQRDLTYLYLNQADNFFYVYAMINSQTQGPHRKLTPTFQSGTFVDLSVSNGVYHIWEFDNEGLQSRAIHPYTNFSIRTEDGDYIGFVPGMVDPSSGMFCGYGKTLPSFCHRQPLVRPSSHLSAFDGNAYRMTQTIG